MGATKNYFPPPEKVITPAQFAKHERRSSAIEEANATALPGALREAYAGEPRRLHGFTFQPVNAWLIANLTRIGSPLLEIIRIYRKFGQALAAAKTDKAREAVQRRIETELEKLRPDPAAVVETVFCFVTDAELVEDLLNRGREVFRRRAMKNVGKVHPAQLSELEKACGEHFGASFATALAIAPSRAEDGGGKIFTPPPPAPTTASAGGSTSLEP